MTTDGDGAERIGLEAVEDIALLALALNSNGAFAVGGLGVGIALLLADAAVA